MMTTMDATAANRQGVSAMGDPVFETTRNALVFAFRFSSAQYGEGTLGKLLRRGAGSGRGLSGLDGAGQAGMVLATVWRLKEIERAAIVARFSPRSEPCPCCGGAKMPDIWREAVETLAEWCIQTGVLNIRCRRELVAKHFGMPGVEFAALAARYEINRKTVAEHYRTMARRLVDVEASAQSVVDDAFKWSGMVLAA